MFQSQGGLVKIQNGVWTEFDLSNSALPYNWVDDIDADNQGGVWIAQAVPIYLDPGILYGALVRFDKTGQHVLKPAVSGKTSNRVHSLAIDQQGNLWFATGVDGAFSYDLTVYDGTTWFVLSAEYADFPHMFIPEITVDHLGRIWLGTGKGIYVIEYVSSLPP
jgi:hypothetical protein